MEAQNRFRIKITGKGSSKSHIVDTETCVLGRGKDCDIILDDDLISRYHLKITLTDNIIQIEEMGSTNGSWLNGSKLQKGVKITYSSDAKILLGGLSGLSLDIESISLQNNLIKINSTGMKSDPDKTLVYNLSTSDFKNLQTSTKKVANGRTEIISYSENTSITDRGIQLVEDDTQSVKISAKKPELNKSLENKVKQLVNQESDKLRGASVKEANSIKQKALIEEKEILQKAQREAQEIIENSKKEAVRIKLEAEESIASLKEKIRHSENESEILIKGLKAKASLIEDNILSLSKVESGHIQKMRQIDDELNAAKERVRNESIHLEELKQQSNAVKKNAELKLEELILEERKSRAKLETEIQEARSQTAKIFVEAEKAQAIKEMLEPEIQLLKNDKSRAEKEINDAQINCRRLEYEFEKANKDYNALLTETNEAKLNLENILSKAKLQKEKNLITQQKLEEKEKLLQEKLDETEVTAQAIIEEAKTEASKILTLAQAKSEKIETQNIEALADLEIYKAKFNDILELEKKNKINEVYNEIESIKSTHANDLEKLELKKTIVANEIKLMESNSLKACEKLIIQGKNEAQELRDQASKSIDTLKNAAKNDVINYKEKTLKELATSKENIIQEIQNLKKLASTESAALREEAEKFCISRKNKTEEEIEQLRSSVKKEQFKVGEELAEAEKLKKSLQDALIKTESLMDSNYIQADLKIKSMISKAHEDVAAIEKSAKEIKAKEMANLLEFRKTEIDKIEELKEQFEEYKVTNKNETANNVSFAVQEHLIIEMLKSRNLVLDEKLIKKISEKSKKIVSDASLGRIQANPEGISGYFLNKKKKDYSGHLKIFTAIVLVVGFIYLFKQYPTEIKIIFKDIRAFIKEQGIELPF